jgi:hypothetical protein
MRSRSWDITRRGILNNVRPIAVDRASTVPAKFAIALLNGQIVNAGIPLHHQAVFCNLPIFIANHCPVARSGYLSIGIKSAFDRILTIHNVFIHAAADETMGKGQGKTAGLIESIDLCCIQRKVQGPEIVFQMG